MNDDGGLRVFFPRDSFVTNTSLTHTNRPRSQSEGAPAGNDHIACYGGDPEGAQVTWHNSNGGELQVCQVEGNSSNELVPAACLDCGGRCEANGAVGQDGKEKGYTNIHMYTNASAYVNQELECRVSGGASAFIGIYLKNGGELVSHIW